MRRIFQAAVAATLLAPAVSWAGPQARLVGHKQPSGFPSCVAGTYLGEVTLVQEPPFTFQSLSTIGADGTYVTESTVDFGAGGTVPMAFRSGGRGNWGKVGPDKLKTTYLHFAYDGSGVLVWMEKITAVMTFSRGCASAAGEATYSIYLPDQDPLGDDQPVAQGSATLTMRRLPPN